MIQNRKLFDLLGKLGLGKTDDGSGGQAAGEPLDWMNMDIFGIQSTIGENCRYASCYMNCSKPSLTAKCGPEAYSLYEELVWKIISSATESMASLGLDSFWPQECKVFTAVYDVDHGSDTTTMPKTEITSTQINFTSTQNTTISTVSTSKPTSTATAVISKWTSLGLLFVGLIALKQNL